MNCTADIFNGCTVLIMGMIAILHLLELICLNFALQRSQLCSFWSIIQYAKYPIIIGNKILVNCCNARQGREIQLQIQLSIYSAPLRCDNFLRNTTTNTTVKALSPIATPLRCDQSKQLSNRTSCVSDDAAERDGPIRTAGNN